MLNPSDFFKQALGRKVNIRLSDGSKATGILMCLDGSLNLAL